MTIATGQQALAADVLALAFNSKLKNESRAAAAVTGDVIYTGYGFKPKALICLFCNTGTNDPAGIGFGDVNLVEMCMYRTTNAPAAWEASTSLFINLQLAVGHSQTAVIKTLDADGYTLTWTKTGDGQAGIFIVLALY